MNIFPQKIYTIEYEIYNYISKVGLQVVFLHKTLGGEWYWYKLTNSIDINKFFQFS